MQADSYNFQVIVVTWKWSVYVHIKLFVHRNAQNLMLSHYLAILNLVRINESLKMEYSMSVNITVLTLT